MSSEKTEQPTDHKLRKAREDGQVAKSKDMTQALLMAALFAYLLLAGDDLIKRLVDMLAAPAQLYGMSFRGALAILVGQAVDVLLRLMLPFLLIVIVVAVIGEMMQIGLLLAFKMLIPKGDRLNPVTNIKQLFSMRSLVEFLKSNVKVIVLSWITVLVLMDSLDSLLKIPAAGMGAVGLALTDTMTTMVKYTFLAYAVIALFDFAWQRHRHIKDLMMSMDEIKQEYKQMEGDPHMKGHRRQLAQEIAMGEMVERTRDASAVVTNPTHVAVALYYKEGETPLPIVVSKGADFVAQQIKRVAREAGIPIMENVPLARALLATAEIDQYIPAELIEPVAEVIRALKRLADPHAEGDS